MGDDYFNHYADTKFILYFFCCNTIIWYYRFVVFLLQPSAFLNKQH